MTYQAIRVFFRDQHLTPDQQKAFGRLFGELHVHPEGILGAVLIERK